MSDELTPEFEWPTEQERQPVDRYLEMTLAYNHLRDLREASNPGLYGPGIDFYEEYRIRVEQERGW